MQRKFNKINSNSISKKYLSSDNTLEVTFNKSLKDVCYKDICSCDNILLYVDSKELDAWCKYHKDDEEKIKKDYGLAQVQMAVINIFDLIFDSDIVICKELFDNFANLPQIEKDILLELQNNNLASYTLENISIYAKQNKDYKIERIIASVLFRYIEDGDKVSQKYLKDLQKCKDTKTKDKSLFFGWLIVYLMEQWELYDQVHTQNNSGLPF